MNKVILSLTIILYFSSEVKSQHSNFVQTDTAKEYVIYSHDSLIITCEVYRHSLLFAYSLPFGVADYIAIKFSKNDEQLLYSEMIGDCWGPIPSQLRTYDFSKKQYDKLISKPIEGIRYFVEVGVDTSREIIPVKNELLEKGDYQRTSELRLLYRIEYIPIEDPTLFQKWLKKNENK